MQIQIWYKANSCQIHYAILQVSDRSISFSSPIKDFFGRSDFLFVMKESGEKCSFHTQMPKPKDIKGNKAIIIVKAREEQETDEPGFPTGIDKEVVFMELAKPVLDNLYSVG